VPEPLEIEVELDTTKASRILDDFADDAQELIDRYHPIEVPVEVDAGQATGALDDVKAAAGDVDALDPKVEVTADTAKAEQGLDAVKGKASDASGTVGTLRDLGAPLDEAFSGLSGTAGDFGEAFQIAGDKIGGAMGLGQEAIGKLSMAMGVGGVALGAVLTFWKMFQQGAEDAKKATEEVIKTQQAMAAGDMAKVAGDIQKKLGSETVRALQGMGVSAKQITDYVTGTSSELGLLTGKARDLRLAWEEAREPGKDQRQTEAILGQLQAVEKLTGQVGDYRDTWINANGTLQESTKQQFEMARALGATTDDMMEMARTVAGPTRAAILTHIATVEGIPQSVLTRILTDTDPDDYAQVKAELEALKKPVVVPVVASVRVDAGQVAQQVATAVALAGGNATTAARGVQSYTARNGPP
jgi:hypothetical protein